MTEPYDPAREGAQMAFDGRMSYTDYLALDAVLTAQHPRSAAILKPMLDHFYSQGESGLNNDSLGADPQVFFRDLPLPIVISFVGGVPGKSPDEVVEGLLAQL